MEDDEEDRGHAKAFGLEEDDLGDITRQFSAYIDVRRYYVFVSARNNQLSAIWKDREKRKNWTKYKRATQKLKDFKHKVRTMYSGFTMKMSREDNWTRCAEKARVWQQWHSDLWYV